MMPAEIKRETRGAGGLRPTVGRAVQLPVVPRPPLAVRERSGWRGTAAICPNGDPPPLMLWGEDDRR